MRSKGEKLKELISTEGIVVMPGVYDGFSVRVAENAGFKAALISGAGLSESRLGRPDVGIMGLQENVEACRALSASSDLLLIADGDTGYGNAVNVFFAVRAFESAGVAGVMIEDQVWPKRCGHMPGKQVIDAQEMVEKVHAAVEARIDPAFVIKARTDAAGPIGLHEAVRRANLYAEAGADLLFADALLSEDDIAIFAREVTAPVCVNMGFGLRVRSTTPLVSPDRLQSLGVAVVEYPRMLTAAAVQAHKTVLRILRESIDQKAVIERPDLLVGFDELNDLMGLPDIVEMERRYATT